MTNRDPQPSSTSVPKGRAAEQPGGVPEEIKGAAADVAREARAAGEAARQEVSNLGGCRSIERRRRAGSDER